MHDLQDEGVQTGLSSEGTLKGNQVGAVRFQACFPACMVGVVIRYPDS